LRDIDWAQLSREAWRVREHAYLFGKTAVGAALLTAADELFSGCNIEHRFRSHDIHAEVNAITSMVARGHRELRVILVVAERERFTPCGACMDWIFQFGGDDCIVGYQVAPDGDVTSHTAAELMPFYPR